MPDFSLFGDGQSFTNDARGGNSSLINVTTSSSPDTMGSWVELIASTAIEAAGFFLFIKPHDRFFGGGSPLTAPVLIDIGIGAAASEVILIDKILHGTVQLTATNHPNNAGMTVIQFPIGVPLGTRISARAQTTSAGTSGGEPIPVGISLYGLSLVGGEPCGGCTTYGVNTGSSIGTSVTSDSSPNGYGPYSELTSSLTRSCVAVILCLYWDPGVYGFTGFLDIGIGSSGMEVAIIEKLPILVGEDSHSMVTPRAIGPLPLHLNQGERIAVRLQASSASAILYASLIAIEG